MTAGNQQFIDASGLECPEPVRLTALAIKKLHGGQILSILSTDPVSPIDLQAWCARTRHDFLSSEEKQEGWLIRIRKRKINDHE